MAQASDSPVGVPTPSGGPSPAAPAFSPAPAFAGREVLVSPAHVAFRNDLKNFIAREVDPIATEFERESRFPMDLLKAMGLQGYMGIPYPREAGGLGLDYLSYAIAIEEISRAWGSLGIIVAAHTTLGTGPLYNFGSEELKRKWLPRLASGEVLGAYGLTEPGAGTDSGATATKGVLDGDHYILNGTKAFCTTATWAATCTLTAVTGIDDRGGKRITAFFVERAWPGVDVTRHEDKLGLRASDTSTLVLEDARVPATHILGQEGGGFRIFMQTLDNGRISIGAMALGLAQRALDEAVAYASARMGLFKSLFDEQETLATLADMATEVVAARMLVYTAARLKDAGLTHTQEASMAKFYASEAAMRATDRALTILGREGGITHDHPASRAFRDVKLCQIGEGTSEIQRLVIARELLRAHKEALAPLPDSTGSS